MSTLQERLSMARAIVDFEARRDSKKRLKVYKLPINDGGGRYEVAGINERYHPAEAAHLAGLIESGRFEEAEDQAREYIALFTDHVVRWTDIAAIESYLRDCSFNRGPRGAARILQRSLGVADDGAVGSITLTALREAERRPEELLSRLRVARERYERDVVGRDESSEFWKGLVNRWNKALEFARRFLNAGGARTGAAMATAAEAALRRSTNFFVDVITRDARFDSEGRVSDPALLEPTTRAAVEAIISDAKALGIDLVIYETFRSKRRQEALFRQGATKLKKVGVHHYGLACDLVKDVRGEPSWKGDFGFLGGLARAHGMIWGGDWGEPGVAHSFVDSVHVQRVTLKRQASLFTGRWYPDLAYDPYEDGAR